MRKLKKIKEIVSRPARHTSKMRKPLTVTVPHRKSLSTARSGFPHQPNFSLEEEAARLAYRYGITTLSNKPYRIFNEHEADSEAEVPVEVTEEKDMTNRDSDQLIEKLRRKIGMEEKEGWEAFYN